MPQQAKTNTLHAAIATKEDLMAHFDPVRVQGYCRSCENHGRVWSCPPFASSPLADFPAWTHAVIVCQQTWLEAGTTKAQLLERFLAARVNFGARMRQAEARHPRVTALVAGHCAECESCTRTEGKPCHAPERLRYSPEAVGFDVTGLTEALAGIKVHWPKTGVPDYLTTVGALLCPDDAVAVKLRGALTSECV